MNIRLPFPVTGSRKSSARQWYIRESKDYILRIFPDFTPFQCDVIADFRFCPPDNSQRFQRRDLDNLLKPVLDIMKGTIIADDSQVKVIYAEMLKPHGKGYVTVKIFSKKRKQGETR